MRRVLLFLALLGLGLAALFLLRPRAPKSTTSSVERNAPPSAGGQFTEVPVAPEQPGQPQESVGLLLQGELDVTQYAGDGPEKKPLRKLHAEDAQSLGGSLYVLRKMVVRILNPVSGATTTQLSSPRTRLKIEVVGGKPRIGEADKALLSDVEATLYERAPVVPLTLKVPLLEWRIGENRLLSDSPVRISGSGLEARGDALDADLESGSLVLPRSGSIELGLPNGERASLAATGTGPVAIRRIEAEGEQRLEIAASEGAKLSASGVEPLDLRAREIRLLARAAGPGGKELELVSVDAQGDVVAESRGDTFRSEVAHFRVTPQGRLEHADLDGSVSLHSGEGGVRGEKAVFEFSATGQPASAHVEGGITVERGEDVFRSKTADFTFGEGGKLARATLVGEPAGTVAAGRYLPVRERELRAAHAEISGTGPLVLEFGEETVMDLAGRGDLKVPEADLTVHAERSLIGKAATGGKSGSLAAEGGVRASWGGSVLASESVLFKTTTPESGETIVEAESFGATTVHRTAEDGTSVDLVAREGLEARAAGKRVSVKQARGVEITASGAQGFHARAGLVRDLDWDARTFTAEEDVSYDSEEGSGSADRAVARGPEDLELTGSAGRPAHYRRKGGEGAARFEEASIDALSIHAQKDALDASGEVLADFVAAEATYKMEAGELHVEFGTPSGPEPGSPRPYEARASVSVRTQVRTPKGESTLACDRVKIVGTTKGTARAGAEPVVLASDVRAEGSVVVDWRSQGGIAGQGDLFTLDPQGHGRLSADAGKRVSARGNLAPNSAPYALDADWVEFDARRLEARKVDLRLDPQAASGAGANEPNQVAPQTGLILGKLTADHLVATPTEVLLEGAAHVDGHTQQGESWAIDAGALRVGGQFAEKKRLSPADLEVVQAWDGFEASLGERAHARGKRLEDKAGRIRLEGEPAELSLGPIAMRSPWIEFDIENMLLGSDKGELGPSQATPTPWSITYESLRPFDREDKTILALRNPVFRDGDIEMRALWMLFWVDREEWKRSGSKALSETASGPDLRVKIPEGAPEAPREKTQVERKEEAGEGWLARARADIRRYQGDPMSKVLSEAYIEGNIELTEKGRRKARASAIYLDVVEGRGWVRDADVLEDVEIRDKDQQLRVQSKWMRLSSDLSLRADRATLSFCGFDVPHYVVETSELRMKPNGTGKLDYDVSATGNALRFENGWAIPLPPLVYAKDEQGNPIIENLSLGQSAKFGALVGATFNLGLGKIGTGIGKVFGTILSLPSASVKGHWRFHANYLGTRGVLAGTGLELKSGDRFKLETDFDAIPDRGEDRGLIRVPKEDRSFLRDWFRARGRYTVSKDEWFDLALSLQSDPGVQAEFFEGEFLRYEQKDNYLHWRKANDAWLFSASVKPRLEDRADVEELPKAGVFHGRAPIGKLFGLDLLYTGSLDAAYLRLRQGAPDFFDPVNERFGNRDVARADTLQRFETPFSVGFAGLHATPWVAARATVWDRGIDPEISPSRSAALVGFDLSTTAWKRYGKGFLHTLTPFVSVHGDLAADETGGAPVPFDQTEDPIEGRFLDIGLRSRLWKPTSPSRFDTEVRMTRATDLPNGAPDETRPLSVLSELLTWVGKVPIGITHDGRYEFRDGETVYSRTFLGIRPHPSWDIEFGYHRGLDPTGALLYGAASAATRYRASDKWEIEVGETISVVDDRGLESNLTLRRIGHDFVTETEVGYTAGEGTRFSINLTPLLVWRPSGIGILDRWLGR